MPKKKQSRSKETLREKILAAAIELFYTEGYDNTSVEAIIQKAGASKGAFYHYFDSKEAVADEIAQQFASGLESVVQDIVARRKMSALEKFNAITAETGEYKFSFMEQYPHFIDLIVNDTNADLQHRIIERSAERMRKLLEIIFIQGNEEGVFTIPYPEKLGEFYMFITNIILESILKEFSAVLNGEADIDAVAKTLQFYEDMWTKLLGAQPGSITFAERSVQELKAFLKTRT